MTSIHISTINALETGPRPDSAGPRWKKFPRFLLALCFTFWLAGCSSPVRIVEAKAGIGGTLEDRLAAAQSAWEELEQHPADSGVRSEYNAAVGLLFTMIREAKLKPWAAPIHAGAFTLGWRMDADPEWNPEPYDLIAADCLAITGSQVERRILKPGLGVPLVAKRSAEPLREYAPTPHFYYAATGVARFVGKRCVLALQDPMESESVRLAGREFPLAADFTAPSALMLAEMEKEKLGIPRLLHPAKYAATAHISRLEPFDPDKTVVLLVHGLMSSPATWFPMLNQLQSNDSIRRNYQFWFFSYPTGYPYSYSAAILRKELDAAEKQYPMKHKMVVVGHSMGGCISRLLITDTGDRIWNELFDSPPDQMNLSPAEKHILTESSIFRHRPEIGRVIFISAPLRGADLTSGWLAHLADHLISLPGNLLDAGLKTVNPHQPVSGQKHLARFPTSLDTLSEHNDFVLALQKVPVTVGIPHHTIAGDRGKGDAPNSSDGLVPYWSSHLPSAESEKIVPSHHPAHQHPQGIAEVLRILELHAKTAA